MEAGVWDGWKASETVTFMGKDVGSGWGVGGGGWYNDIIVIQFNKL